MGGRDSVDDCPTTSRNAVAFLAALGPVAWLLAALTGCSLHTAHKKGGSAEGSGREVGICVVDAGGLLCGVSAPPPFMSIPVAPAPETRPAPRPRPWSERLIWLTILALLIVSWLAIGKVVLAGVSWLGRTRGVVREVVEPRPGAVR